MKTVIKKAAPITFSPQLHSADPLANYWMQQVTLRLRREICWLRHQRGANHPEALPPFTDQTFEILDQARFCEEKNRFFQTDITAKYLTTELARRPPNLAVEFGTFSWVINELHLNDTSVFVLAMGLAVAFDSSMGNVIATCLNDPTKNQPNLMLAQKLWDIPQEVLCIADPDHPLFRSGLLHMSFHSTDATDKMDWVTSLSVPSPIVNHLLFPETPPPGTLRPVEIDIEAQPTMSKVMHLVASRVGLTSESNLNVIPILGPKKSQHLHSAYIVSSITGKELVRFSGNPSFLVNSDYRNSLAAICWLKGLNLFYDEDEVALMTKNKTTILPLQSIPISIFLAINSREQLKDFSISSLLPVIEVPKFSYQERVAFWHRELGDKTLGLDSVIYECARRFRYQKKIISSICQGLNGINGPISDKALMEACRVELDNELGPLAQKVTPRFLNEEVILPHKQTQQLKEINKAMTSITDVHYNWGTAQVWNESGISVLFAGPPGTGKTMAAEVLAIKLNLPIYRIDLSQVVNKYIGETEKNLKRLFDVADMADLILFFDEADSLFGQRTEVKDAHDRYANLEISYLLERMERFKGVAILATNRKKDLDEAFLRRLRYIVDFPLPEVEQRKRIWRQLLPSKVDHTSIDFNFLAEKFPLAGGHIRSIIFNACLQSANQNRSGKESDRYKLEMEALIRAVKREYEKLNRSISLEQFGKYADVVMKMEKENG